MVKAMTDTLIRHYSKVSSEIVTWFTLVYMPYAHQCGSVKESQYGGYILVLSNAP